MDKLDWERHVVAFKESNLSARAYAKQHELVYHRFLYRLRQFSQIEASDSSFAPVGLATPTVDGACLGIVEFPTGVRLIVHRPEVVQMLLQWLHGRS